MALVLPTWYATGTVTVTGGSKTVTGQNVSWGDDAILPGDLLFLNGQPSIPPQRVANVIGDDEIELVEPWPGVDATEVAYELRYASIIERSTAQTRKVLEEISVLRANSMGLLYGFGGVGTDVDPGDGLVKWNNADPSLVTEIYASNTDANRTGRDVSSLMDLWAPGTVLIFRSFATTAYVAFQIIEVAIGAEFARAVVSFVGPIGATAFGAEAISIEWVITGEGLQINASGDFAGRSAYDDEPAGFMYLSINGNGSDNLTPSLYRKNTATSGDWSAQIPFQGPRGYAGWAPVFGAQERNGGTEAVLKYTDWVGGEGPKPTDAIGQFVSTTGPVPNANDAVNVKGVKGDPNGIRLTMVNAVSTGVPAAGTFGTNNTAFAAVTELRFNLAPVDMAGNSIATWLQTLDDIENAVSRGTLRFQSPINSASFMEFAVNGPITSEPNYFAIPVTPIAGTRPAVDTVFAASFVPSGKDGLDGTDPGIFFDWDEDNTDADPGAGNIRADSADLSEAEFIYVSKENRTGDDVSAYLLGLASSTNPIKGELLLNRTDGNAQATFNVTGITDATGYVKVAIVNPSGATGFLSGNAISFQFNRAGNQGSSDAVSIASSINGSPDVSSPAFNVNFAITDPANENALSKITLETIARALGIPLETYYSTASIIALQTASNSGAVLFGMDWIADSFDTLTYIDTAGSSNIDPLTPGLIKPTRTPATLDFMNVATDGSDVATYTFTAQPFGAASADRFIVAAVETRANTARTISSVTIGGIAATLVVLGNNAASGAELAGLYIAHVPTGTSGTIVVNCSGAMVRCAVATYRLTNLQSSLAIDTDAANGNATSASVQIDIAAGGPAISAIKVASTSTWTYLNKDYDQVAPDTGGDNFTFASRLAPAAVVGQTITDTFAVSSVFTMVAASWAPSASSINNMSVLSEIIPSVSVPTRMRALLLLKEVTAAVANTDYVFECSRDNGASWSAMPLTELFTSPSPIADIRVVEAEETDISGQGSGISLRWRFSTITNKNIELHGVKLDWY